MMARLPGWDDGSMQQGAVGQVRLVRRGAQVLVEKRIAGPARLAVEALALRALAATTLPVPRLVEAGPDAVVMTRMPGERLDSVGPDARIEGLRAAAAHLRQLHAVEAPAGLPPAPDDEGIIQRYRRAGGPPLPLAIPSPSPPVFCHGDWSDGNLLATEGRITGIVDWERAHLGDPLREVSRCAWGAARKDPRSFDAIVDAYGADPRAVRPWLPIHAAELWLWFADAGPAEYLEQLTAELRDWSFD